jgi:hypothetical protein
VLDQKRKYGYANDLAWLQVKSREDGCIFIQIALQERSQPSLCVEECQSLWHWHMWQIFASSQQVLEFEKST